MYTWGLDFLSPRDALVSKSLLVALGLVLTLLFRIAFRALRKESWPAAAFAACLVGASFGGALVWRETHILLFQAYDSFLLSGHMAVRFVPIPIGTFLYDGLVLLAWSLLYFAITTWIELAEQRLRATRAEALAHAARLRALQSQLKPHFLFNTLNAISTLIVERRNDDAARMISRLSDFLRFTLETTQKSQIPLAEELDFARRYLAIEQVRFGSRLRVTINIDPDVLSALVPTLVLQPLIENAVKYGVLPHEDGGSVWVTAQRKNGSLQLCVADDGPGIQQDHPTATGVGLSNTANRLHELYGAASRLSLSPALVGGLAVTIEIPFHPAVAAAARESSEGARPS